MSPLAIIGSNSMVGSRFCEMAEEELELIKTDLNGSIPLDITDKKNVDDFFQTQNFEYAILFSAFTDVDAAEVQRDDKNGSCWHINVDGAENVAEAASKSRKKLITISTDFVFDGTAGPYSEEKPTGQERNKVSWYGLTKIESEKKVKNVQGSIIIRISYPYRANFSLKEDFARGILRKSEAGELHPMFNDQKITPTFTDDIFPAIKLLIEKKQSGIFHVASPQITTPYEFAIEVIKASGKDTQNIKEGSLEEFLKRENSTPRPLNGGMIVEKITKLGFCPTNYKTGIRELFNQMESH